MALIALVDDHILLRNGLSNLLKDYDHTVLFEASNGKELIEKLTNGIEPEIVLLDINMPIMDGYETAKWLKDNHPDVKVLALTMDDNEAAIIRMLKAGAKGYILKDCDPSELNNAIKSLQTKNFYQSELVSGRLIHAINNFDDDGRSSKPLLFLTEKELEFLRLVCSEMTYKEIASKMNVSPRTVDNYRDNLFEKLNVKSRVGLVMFAIKNRIVVV